MKTTKNNSFKEKYLLKYRPFFWSLGNITLNKEENNTLQPLYVVEKSN